MPNKSILCLLRRAWKTADETTGWVTAYFATVTRNHKTIRIPRSRKQNKHSKKVEDKGYFLCSSSNNEKCICVGICATKKMSPSCKLGKSESLRYPSLKLAKRTSNFPPIGFEDVANVLNAVEIMSDTLVSDVTVKVTRYRFPESSAFCSRTKKVLTSRFLEQQK